MKTITTILLCTCATGCTWFQNDVNRGYAEHGEIVGGRVYTTADIRIVSQRIHPVTGQPVSCTEPSPDIAKALSTASQLSLKGGTKNASGELGAAGGSSEAVAELAGRSTALIALRDGLYRTCEAYVNGAIGADAYSLVLSRYGQLMTTLFVGEDIRSVEHTAATVTGAALINLTGLQSSASDAKGSTSSTTDQSKGTSGSDQSKSNKTAAAAKTPTSTVAANPLEFLRVAATGGSKAGSTAGAPAPTPSPAPGQASPAITTDPKTATTTQDTDSSVAAQLVKLNQAYFDLDSKDLDHLLIVACVNEFDLTRKRARVETATQGHRLGTTVNPQDDEIVDVYGQNGWLRTVCNSMKDVATLSKLQAMSRSSSSQQQDKLKLPSRNDQRPTT